MAAVRRSNTKPELRMRSLLHALGLRFRLQRKSLPGTPDIVLSSSRIAIFCDGDFWHGRNWEARLQRVEFKTRPEFWKTKIETNIARDRRVNAALEELGWKVVRIWESDIKRDGRALADEILALHRTRKRGSTLIIGSVP